jgi:hypothetical protein
MGKQTSSGRFVAMEDDDVALLHKPFGDYELLRAVQASFSWR